MSSDLLRKSQIKMFESIAMLLVFMFLVAIGIQFYGSFEMNRLGSMQQRFAVFDSVKTAVALTNLPELKCTIQNVPVGSCIDMYKAYAWEQESGSGAIHNYYFELLGPADVVLEQFSPDPLNWTIYSSPPHNVTNIRYTPLPVAIWNSVDRHFGFGVLHVRVYTS